MSGIITVGLSQAKNVVDWMLQPNGIAICKAGGVRITPK